MTLMGQMGSIRPSWLIYHIRFKWPLSKVEFIIRNMIVWLVWNLAHMGQMDQVNQIDQFYQFDHIDFKKPHVDA